LEQYYQRHGHLFPLKNECKRKRRSIKRRYTPKWSTPTKYRSESPKRRRQCGPKCFADKEQKVPICPRCDSHRCRCYPDCDLLEKAYKRGFDKDTMKDYAKHLNCKWIRKIELPPHFDNIPEYNNTKPENLALIGKQFRAPDNKIHTIVGVSKKFVHTKTDNQKFQIPIRYFI
jgi:hypothetical protein